MRRASFWATLITTPRTYARNASKRSDFWSPPNVEPTRTPTAGVEVRRIFHKLRSLGQRELQRAFQEHLRGARAGSHQGHDQHRTLRLWGGCSSISWICSIVMSGSRRSIVGSNHSSKPLVEL